MMFRASHWNHGKLVRKSHRLCASKFEHSHWSIGCELQLLLADKSKTNLWTFLSAIPWSEGTYSEVWHIIEKICSCPTSYLSHIYNLSVTQLDIVSHSAVREKSVHLFSMRAWCERKIIKHYLNKARKSYLVVKLQNI